MTFQSWLRRLTRSPAPNLKKSRPSAARTRGTRHRPSVERLEDRTLLSLNFGSAFNLGGAAGDIGYHVAADAIGNSYVAGVFGGTMDADPDPALDKQVLLTANGVNDAFVAKYGPAGNLLWARRMGGGEVDDARGVAVDLAGNVYLTGSFSGTADFGGLTLTSAGQADVFVTKLDVNGTFLWADGLTGTSGPNRDFGFDLAVDGSGNVYTTGLLELDPNALFVSKHNAAGQRQWVQQIGGGLSQTVAAGHGIAADAAGNVFVTGTYQGLIDFNPGPATYTLSSTKNQELYTRDAFVWKLDAAGNFVWAGSMGGKGADEGLGVAVDGSGNVYVAGDFGPGTVNDFDPGSAKLTLKNAGSYDVFVVKLDANRNLLWARGMGGTGWDYGTGIAVDTAGNVYTTGGFGYVSGSSAGASADFNPGSATYTLTSAGYADVFVSQLSSAGNFVWAGRMGGADDNWGEGVALDGSGNVYTTGIFRGTADFDPGAGTYSLTSTLDSSGNPTLDAFVSKLVPLSALQAADAAAPKAAGGAILSADQVTPLLTEALARWQAAGVDTSSLSGVEVRIADVGGATLGLAFDHTITLDDNAAGRGWFVAPTSSDDSAFAAAGSRGEMNRIDLLTSLKHEMGPMLGHDHTTGDLMNVTVATAARLAPADIDALFAEV